MKVLIREYWYESFDMRVLIRKFLTEPEYLPILQKQEKHLIKIKRQAIVQKGTLRYIPPPDRLDRRRERDIL